MNQDFHVHSQGCLSCGHKLCAQKVSLFENLTEPQLRQVIALITRRVIKKGDYVFRESDLLDNLFIINSGSLKISSINSEGKEQMLYYLTEGEFIGDLALLKSTPASFSAQAITDTHLCCIHNNDFQALMLSHQDILRQTLAYAHDRIASLEKLVQTVSTNEADTRLTYLMKQLAEKHGVITKEGLVITLELTREEMANFMGVSRETVSRKLNHLIKSGLITRIDNKHLLLSQDYTDYLDL